MTQKSRRKLSNFLVDPMSLWRVSIPFLILSVTSIGVVFAIHIRVLRALEQTELFGVENIAVMNALHETQESVTRIGSLGIAGLCVVCLGLWVVFSHRIFGPTVPIRRHIQNLTKGDYSSRITPRPGDELKEVTDDLNLLAEALGSKKN